MYISKHTLVAILSSFLVFIYTYYLGSMFLAGDQLHYRMVYDSVSHLDFFEGYLFYRTVIYTDEVGHYVIAWSASQFFDKDIFNAFSNSLLAYFSVKLFIKWGAKPFVALLLVLFGYYYLALYLSAERLKYATVFFVLAVYYFRSGRLRYVFFVVSIITHLQYVVPIIASLFVRFSVAVNRVFNYLRLRTSDAYFLLMSAVALALLSFVFSGHIYNKISAYHEGFDVLEYLRISVFFLMSLWYSKKKIQVIMVFFVLFVFVALVGGMRINMFGYFAFLYYSLRVNGGLNLGVIATFLYFFVGWLEYSYLVYSCGVNRPC